MKKKIEIGLALSGGGFRATGYHLGVLARLAKEKRLEDVSYLSTVSGGSMCIGMVYALNGFKWPTSDEYLNKVMPEAREMMTSMGLLFKLISWVFRMPLRLLSTRASALSYLMKRYWEIDFRLKDIPDKPRWMINATCYETGKNWRFENFRMGDYKFGYTHDTDIPLSDAVAASAGFPGPIGPLVLKTGKFNWFKYEKELRGPVGQKDPNTHMERKTKPIQPAFSKVHLWDGGLYDNLGLEGLHNFRDGWREGVDFLIVSDASGRAKSEKYNILKALLRMITGVTMDQIRSLRSRAVLERMLNPNGEDPGGFLQIGNTCEHVLKNSEKKAEIPTLRPKCLDKEKADKAANMGTTIKTLSQEDFDLLFRHGFEVADYTLYGHSKGEFGYVGFENLN